MNFAKYWAVIALTSLALTGCGQVIVVENKTSFDVKVIVWNNNRREVLSPSPGNSSSMDAINGSYAAAAVRSEEWINYAKATRQYLNGQLGKMDTLTGAQLFEVVQRLKDIAKKMAEYENAKSGAYCSGNIAEDANGLATVNVGAGGALVVVCK